MFSAMIGMPTARSSSAATLMSPPMIEPARTSSRARGRSATARTAAAMFSSPTSGIVSTLIRSPRRLWRSASLTAPSATWATWAPPPTTMIRLPKTRSRARVRWTRPDVGSRLERLDERVLGRPPRPRARSRPRGGSPSIRRTVASARIRPPGRRPLEVTDGSDDAVVDDVEPDRRGLGPPRRFGISPASRGRPPRAEGRRRSSSRARRRRSGRAPRTAGRGRRTPRGSRRGSRGREHQRAVGVLGDADDPGDVDAALAERRRHAGERARPIVELDREPDRHRGTSCCAVDGTRSPADRPVAADAGAPWRYARRHAGSARHDADQAACPTSRSSGSTTRSATRAALRFFQERRVVVHFVDLRKRPIAPGELRRFIERLGAAALLDETSRPTATPGLGYLRLDDADDRGAAAGRRPAAPPAARPPRQRGDGRSRRDDLDGVAQARERALNAVQPRTTPTTARTGPDDRPADVADP